MSDEHMWLIPFTEGQNHTMTIDLGERRRLLGLRVWNYNKSQEDTFRGVRNSVLFLSWVLCLRNKTCSPCLYGQVKIEMNVLENWKSLAQEFSQTFIKLNSHNLEITNHIPKVIFALHSPIYSCGPIKAYALSKLFYYVSLIMFSILWFHLECLVLVWCINRAEFALVSYEITYIG